MSGGDPDTALAALRRRFAGRLPGRLAELAAAVEAGDWAGAGRLAHRLHGTAGSYGFAAVSTACAVIEQLCDAAAPEPDADARERIRAALAAADRAGTEPTPDA